MVNPIPTAPVRAGRHEMDIRDRRTVPIDISVDHPTDLTLLEIKAFLCIMKSSSAIAAVAVAMFFSSTSTAAIVTPQPSQNQTWPSSSSPSPAARTPTTNAASTATLPTSNAAESCSPIIPPDGSTSDKCITACASYRDLCIQAVDRNENLPFKYAFSYPEADVNGTITGDDDFEGEDDINELEDGLTERAAPPAAS
ncbi:hypothetical protein HDU96_003791 [Phlyctochytrium bullatum]|nr:hypothetical protein HDU96_003791 [Phlyctochytrium bullatum]